MSKPGVESPETPLTRVSITGIDGSGKDTVARMALTTMSHEFPVVKIGRPAYSLVDGVATQIFSKTTRAFDFAHRQADRYGSSGGIVAANAINVVTQARLIESLATRMQPRPVVLASSRDPRIDPAVYMSYYSPDVAARMTMADRIKHMQRITNVQRDLIVLLRVSPALAVERIDARIAAEQVARNQTGERSAGLRDKWRHKHENAEDLGGLQLAYTGAVGAYREVGLPGKIVEIQTDERDSAAVSELVVHAIHGVMSGAITAADQYRL
jgi:thymidylate kinase